MIRKYNYHNWSKFMVREFKEKPTGPHYAALVFQFRQEYQAAYDAHDSGGYYSAPEVVYFAFAKKEDLDTWIAEATMEDMKFIFFHVPKLGQLTMKVNTDV